jgi:hypothetical protein
MTFNARNISEKIATLAVFCIFSGYFFYHYLVAAIGLPRFLSGYYSPLISFFTLIILIVQSFRPSLIFTKSDRWIYLVLLLMLILSIIYFVFGNSLQSRQDYAVYMTQSIWTFFGTYLIIRNANLKSEILIKSVSMLLLIQISIIIYFGLIDGNFRLSSMTDNKDLNVSGYQQIAAVLLFQFGLVMSAVKKNAKAAIFLIGLLALFYNGARSEFMAFLLSGMVLVILSFKRKYAALAYGLVLLIIGLYIAQYMRLAESGARTMSALDIFNESSYIARIQMSDNAIQCISETPFLGCYGDDLLLGEGSYSHNILSAWQTYGAAVFVMWLMLFIGKIRSIFAYMRDKYVSSGQLNNISELAIYYLIIALFMMIFSKSFLDSVFAISLSIMAQHENSLYKDKAIYKARS